MSETDPDPRDQRIAELEAALNGVLAYEKAAANIRGFADCTCIAQSRSTEVKYESGKCPHQIGRRLITPDTGG